MTMEMPNLSYDACLGAGQMALSAAAEQGFKPVGATCSPQLPQRKKAPRRGPPIRHPGSNA